MKSTILLLAGVSIGLASLLLSVRRKGRLNPRAVPPVDELAHRLQDAWADHHTVA
jgi:hypothetical protein